MTKITQGSGAYIRAVIVFTVCAINFLPFSTLAYIQTQFDVPTTPAGIMDFSPWGLSTVLSDVTNCQQFPNWYGPFSPPMISNSILYFKSLDNGNSWVRNFGASCFNGGHTYNDYLSAECADPTACDIPSRFANLFQNFGSDGLYRIQAEGYLTGVGSTPNYFTQFTIANGLYSTTTTSVGTSTPSCLQDCFSNVLFLPGIEASRLYYSETSSQNPSVVVETRAWEPDSDAAAQNLAMDLNGKSIRSDIYTRDVLDVAYPIAGPNIYKSFILQMNNLKANGTFVDWSAVPYDWRLSLDDILNGGIKNGDAISYTATSSGPYILTELKRLASTSKTKKVTIIAHSNGGLLTKALMIRLGADGSKYVDKIIFVDVPQLGTPAALAGLLNGTDQDMTPFLSQSKARFLAQNFPMTYNLLPSNQYFAQVDDPVLSFDPTTFSDWANKYGVGIHSETGLQNFVLDSSRIKPAASDVATPEIGNANLYAKAIALHTILDSWTPPSDIKLYLVNGWGNETLSGIEYTKETVCTDLIPQFTKPCAHLVQNPTINVKHVIDGDGRVIEGSAMWANGATSTQRFWVDLRLYNRNNFCRAVYCKSHANILEVSDLETLIQNIIISKAVSAFGYISTVAPTDTNSSSRLHFTLHSPLTLGVSDMQGNYTGATATSSVSNIPGVTYERYGDTQWLSIPQDLVGKLIMHGTANGSFTLNVDQVLGDTVMSSTTFATVPTSTSTIVFMNISPEYSATASSTLYIDGDGNGTPDIVLQEKQNQVVTPDFTPPEIQLSFGTSTQQLSITATDDRGYATTSITVIYPMLKKNQTTYKGVATTTIVARDSAGNNTVLIYTEELPAKNGRINIIPIAISYNGATTTLTNSILKYKWNFKNGYLMLASFIQTGSTSIESHFRPKKNATILMVKPIDLDDRDSDDDCDTKPLKIMLIGTIIPFITTNSGKIIINY